ncbi:MAG: NADP-dependent phosphogluconate dehydrogenase [Phycisphaeraceae bacterium]|nr:NADP-dependent phosphogluconate dehydrogenase [Phycisphaeraceae bacterium]
MTTPPTSDVGLIGLAVMGQNLALNMADHGFKVSVYNRTATTMAEFVAAHPPGSFGALGGALTGQASLVDFVNSIRRPRKIVIMVKAGGPTDAVIDSLIPLLSSGDIIIDGGNAHWEDTIRRERALKSKGLRFVGSGVSGGEEGARFGPSLMPGGDRESWEEIRPVWTAIAAKVDPATGRPLEGAAPGKPIVAPDADTCAAYIGPDGAGHYVKMVHNGIEYGDMQMICEGYHLLRDILGLSAMQMSEIFATWNRGPLDSFLIQITAEVLRQKDPTTGKPFVDIVLDAAGQKGTGKWTSTSALDMGVPAATIAEAVFARNMSAAKEERVAASKILKGPGTFALKEEAERQKFVQAVEQALYCSKICSYAQGFQLMAAAGRQYNWTFDNGSIAMIWRGGCIIRARFLQKIKEAYDKNPTLANLLLDPFFAETLHRGQAQWRWVIATAAQAGIPVPTLSSALAYFDSYRTGNLPANLLQAQRDYFGAHTYERVDQPRGKFFHLDWQDPKRPERMA